MDLRSTKLIGLAGVLGVSLVVQAAPPARQTARGLLPIEFQNSAEFRWLNKEVLARRVLDDMADPESWLSRGRASWPSPPKPDRTACAFCVYRWTCSRILRHRPGTVSQP